MNCTFEEIEDREKELFFYDEKGVKWRKVRCTRCGFVTAPCPSPLDRVFRECNKMGLGDYAAFGLSAFGITKERVAWVRGLFGETSGCGGCPGRQEALNELGKKVGL